MARIFLLGIALLASICVAPSSAYWNCHGCMESITVNLQVTGNRWAGTDNEYPNPHYVEMEYYCHPHPLPVSEVVQQGENLTDTGILPEPITPHAEVKLLSFQTVYMKIPLGGLILRQHGRRYKINVTDEVKGVCGCAAPINLRNACVKAAHNDGIEIASLSAFGNYDNGVSDLLLLDHKFRNGWLDGNNFPYRSRSRTPPQRAIPLHKAGC